MQSSEGVDDVVVRVHAGVTGEAEDFAFYFGGDWCASWQPDLATVPGGTGWHGPRKLVAHGPLGAQPNAVILPQEVSDAGLLPADVSERGWHGLQSFSPHGGFRLSPVQVGDVDD